MLTTSGGWMAALLGKMLEATDYSFACASFSKKIGKVQHSGGDRITCFAIPAGNGLEGCRNLVREWRPDLLHIHGTESLFGLLTARGLVECPAVISLQGLLGPCSQWYHYFGNRSLPEIARLHRWLDIPALRGQWIEFLKLRSTARREREIIAGNRFFMGRTKWDRSYIEALNPSARYYHGGELLRDSFWKERWDVSRAKRFRIMITNAGHPRKGAEIVFEALKLLRPCYPGIEVAIAGAISRRSGYGRHILRLIVELGDSVIELGPLTADQMVEEMKRSHVFVSPSYIENSSNAVCEAQLLGMPVVAAYTGGLPSIIQEGHTGLFFPTGDSAMLAARLRDVMEDDELAMKIGAQAHEAAARRHDPASVVNGILDVYRDILEQTR